MDRGPAGSDLQRYHCFRCGRDFGVWVTYMEHIEKCRGEEIVAPAGHGGHGASPAPRKEEPPAEEAGA